MTPAVDRVLAVNHSRDNLKVEAPVAAEQTSALKQTLFKSMMSGDESTPVKSTDVEVADTPVEPELTEKSIPEESTPVEGVSDDPVVTSDNVSDQAVVVSAELTAPKLQQPVTIEGEGEAPDALVAKNAVVVGMDSEQILADVPKTHDVQVARENLARPTRVEIPLAVTPGGEVAEKSKPVVKLAATAENVVSPTVPVQSPVSGSVLRASLKEGAPVTPVNADALRSMVTNAEAEEPLAPVVQGATPLLKDALPQGAKKDRAELINAVIEQNAGENKQTRFNQIALDNMSAVEYRNANQAINPMLQSVATEVLSQPVGVGVVTDTSLSGRVDSAQTAQQPLPKLTPNFVSDTSSHIKMMVNHGIGRAAVQLNPADLGAMHISIDLKSDQLNVQISVAQSATREMMESALPRLREQLQAEGYSDINIDLSSDQSGEQQSDQQASADTGFDRSSPMGASVVASNESQVISAMSSKRSLIDLFA